MRILVVEDNVRLSALIVKKLKSENYSVDACLRGDEAPDYLACAEYDALILDVMLPGLSGLDVLRAMRAKHDKTPVLLLTARDSVGDRVSGLDAGADDYLVKPFAFDELTARVRALIRRGTNAAGNVFTAADLTVDCGARKVTRGGRDVGLSAREFAILEYLIRNKGIVLSRRTIGGHIWNYDYEGASNIIDVYIRNLRRKMDSAEGPKLIHTVRGAGYVLREGV
ncbi:MAG: response regulator transcription factor [Oscillospiraceae bacterium]|jgi:DNA-binding response OmpR family regulator|nr:response regulator transcription factor [Oscillospiraceae bacterium]